MNIKLILPINAVFVESSTNVFFLAGPVLGGGDWQSEAIRILERKVTNSYVVCPREYRIENPVSQYAVEGESNDSWRTRGLKLLSDKNPWERYYLELACRSERGMVVFWLPDEDKIFPCSTEDSYGRDAYQQFAQWLVMATKMGRGHVRVAFGAEKGYPGSELLTRSCENAVGNGFVAHKTLQDTIDTAVVLIG